MSTPMEIARCVDYTNLPEGRPVLSTTRLFKCSGKSSVAHFVPPNFFLKWLKSFNNLKRTGKT